MTNRTKAGYELAHRMGDYFKQEGWSWFDLVDTCSLLIRHAKTYHRNAEGHCDGMGAAGNPNIPIAQANRMEQEYSDWLDKRDGQIEKRIAELVATLPELKHGGRLRADFGGDPRGAVVSLILPDGYPEHGDNWNRDGFAVY